MRRIVTFIGVFLLAFPVVALGQVKVRTRTGGYPKWDVPAGDRLARGFKAPVKAGPFTLGFHTQIEVDFESNNQFDFNDDINEGQTNNAQPGVPAGSTGGPLTNAAVGLSTPGDTQRGESFQTEFRLGLDAVAGPLTTHIVLEQTGGPIRDRSSENQSMNVERAWGDVDLGWFNVRYGIELFSLEPTLMLYGDDDPMLAVYKNYGDWAWMIRYMKRKDSDEERTGNTLTTLVPGAVNSSTAGEGTSNDTDVIFVSVEFPIANPMGPGTLSIQPIYVFDSDKRFKAAGTRDSAGNDFDGDIISHYFGANIIGNIGPVKAALSGFFNVGTDDTGFNGLNSATGLPRDEVDIEAWQAFGEFAYPVPNMPLTVSAGVYAASGDDDPFDDEAQGWLGVSHNSEMFNGRDIFIDKTEDGSELTIRLKSNAGVAGAGEAVRLGQDDEAILQGLSNFNNVACAAAGTGCSGAAVAAGNHPTRGVLPTPGSNGNALDPYAVNNRSHPGIIIANVALKYKVLPNLGATADFQHIRLMETDGFAPITAGRATSGILTEGDDIDSVFGNQFSFRLAWKVGKYLVIDPGIVVLVPGDAVDDLTGSDDTAWSFRVGMRWNF